MIKKHKKSKSCRISCLIMPAFVYLGMYVQLPTYEVKNNGVVIGYVKDKKTADKAYEELESEISREYTNAKLYKKNFSFDKVDDDNINISSIEEIKGNMKKTMEIETDGYDMYLNNEKIGTIPTIEDGRKILNLVGDKYIDDLKIKRENIKSVNIDTKSVYKKVRTLSSNIISDKNAAEKILEINNKHNIVNVKVNVIEQKQQIRNQGTLLLSDGDMYLGDKKVINGSPGKDIIRKEVVYINGTKKEENVINENVAIPAIDTIVYKGTRDPILDGVKFLKMPGTGVITSNYGHRHGNIHHGIDIGAKYGDAIKASLDGVVNDTGYDSVYGYYVKINHGKGIETLYGHSSKILVKKGSRVSKGDTIALVGSTGRSTGPHIHFELRTDGVAINPIRYIQ